MTEGMPPEEELQAREERVRANAEGPDEELRERIAAAWASSDGSCYDPDCSGCVENLRLIMPLLTAERERIDHALEGRLAKAERERYEARERAEIAEELVRQMRDDWLAANRMEVERDEARERADRLAQVVEQAESPESIERAAREAFWTDDMGGHVKGRWTWETIPEVGRENFRALVRAVIRTALSRTATEGDDRG